MTDMIKPLLLKISLRVASLFTHRTYEELLTKATTKDAHDNETSNIRYFPDGK